MTVKSFQTIEVKYTYVRRSQVGGVQMPSEGLQTQMAAGHLDDEVQIQILLEEDHRFHTPT